MLMNHIKNIRKVGEISVQTLYDYFRSSSTNSNKTTATHLLSVLLVRDFRFLQLLQCNLLGLELLLVQPCLGVLVDHTQLRSSIKKH